MPNKWKKTGVMGLAVMMMAGVFAGCGTSDTDKTDTAKSKEGMASPTASANSAATQMPIVKDKLTLDFFIKDHATKPITGNEPPFVELEKRTNIHFNFIKTADGFEDKFKITLASGKLPDIMQSTSINDAKRYGMEGAFLPLDDLLKKFGPNILKVMKDRGIEKDVRAADGKIYGIPLINPEGIAHSYMVRQDWLDKLNLKAPNTLDEYYNMLKAFRDNQLAGKDTIPLSIFASGAGGIYAIHNIMEAYNSNYEFMVKDNKYVYGPAEPGAKDAYAYVNKLYAEKLLDPEFGLLSKKQWEGKVSTGNVGSIIYDSARTDFFTDVLKKDKPGAKMVAVAPLQGPDGKRHIMQPNLFGNLVVLGKDTKNAEAAVKFFNYMFSDEGSMLLSFGLENDSYVMKDGKPQYTDKMYEADGLFKYGIGRVLPFNPNPAMPEQQRKGTLTADAIKLQAPYWVKSNPTLNFIDEENDIIKSKSTGVNDVRDKYFLRFVMGEEPFTNWDKYVNDLKKAGLDDLLKVYNDAYQRYLKN
ncbi:extracellular solute-binding protein [Paenibacillus roseipurpureus]|uniref:Extracellular solute-binding protein n=1 Tax=Paenibacillus roseopurpureus TaxID=2918901 RepID=A0AA96RLE5_9BACL|nr:extracellular solute-binding protein [Paenibacillus sp. MBLB1832]WNR45291.1 extracellular solute-binding protein [Paenibacillus sp. MBLB1832]